MFKSIEEYKKDLIIKENNYSYAVIFEKDNQLYLKPYLYTFDKTLFERPLIEFMNEVYFNFSFPVKINQKFISNDKDKEIFIKNCKTDNMFTIYNTDKKIISFDLNKEVLISDFNFYYLDKFLKFLKIDKVEYNKLLKKYFYNFLINNNFIITHFYIDNELSLFFNGIEIKQLKENKYIQVV